MSLSSGGPTAHNPGAIAVGSDGALWFGEGNGSIGRITTSGAISNYGPANDPMGIASGSDGALWYTNSLSNTIGRLTTGGAASSYPVGVGEPNGITAGPDGALWFTEDLNTIGQMTTSGVETDYDGYQDGIDDPQGITTGPDGALWFTNQGNNSIGRITTSGVISNYTASGINSPSRITAGPDGALWFTNEGGNSIGRSRLPGLSPITPRPTSPSLTSLRESPKDLTGICGSPTAELQSARSYFRQQHRPSRGLHLLLPTAVLLTITTSTRQGSPRPPRH
jgi:streptogramin lyase